MILFLIADPYLGRVGLGAGISRVRKTATYKRTNLGNYKCWQEKEKNSETAAA